MRVENGIVSPSINLFIRNIHRHRTTMMISWQSVILELDIGSPIRSHQMKMKTNSKMRMMKWLGSDSDRPFFGQFSINVHRHIDFTSIRCHPQPFLHHDLLHLVRTDAELAISPEGDNPSQNTVDQNMVWRHRCCLSLHVVLCRNGFSFSTASVKGPEKKTRSCCFCLFLCGYSVSCCPSSLWNISFPAFCDSEDSSQSSISN